MRHADASEVAALAERVTAAETDLAALKAPTERERQNAILGWDEDDRAYYAAHADDLAAFRADVEYAVEQYEASKSRPESLGRYQEDTRLVYAPQVRKENAGNGLPAMPSTAAHPSAMSGILTLTAARMPFSFSEGQPLWNARC